LSALARIRGHSVNQLIIDALDPMLAVAARDVDETWLANWLRERVIFRT
jgi:hypothetical protein